MIRKKRGISMPIAKVVLESLDELIVGNQFSVVTEFAANDVVVKAGQIVKIIDVKDDIITFTLEDSTEAKTTITLFDSNCQLMTNSIVNESKSFDAFVDGIYEKEDKDKFVDVAKELGMSNADKASKDDLNKWYKSLSKEQKQQICDIIGADIKQIDEAIEDTSSDTLAFETAVVSNLYASITTAHKLHNNNSFVADDVNVDAIHRALELYYNEMPELADSLGEALNFEKDIVLDESAIVIWSNPVEGMLTLQQSLVSIRANQSAATQSIIDGINAFITSIMYKLVRLGRIAKPILVVTESWVDNYNDKDATGKLSAIKLALMSDGLSYDPEFIAGMPVDEWPDEVKASVAIVCESEAQDAYREFFKKKLEEYGVKSQSELSKEDKEKFFAEIKAEWPDAKEDMLDESFKFDKLDDATIEKLARELNLYQSDDDYKNAKRDALEKDINAELSADTNKHAKLIETFNIAECDESAQTVAENVANIAKAFVVCNDIDKLAKIDKIINKAGVKVTLFDKAFQQLNETDQAEVASILGIELVNESVNAKPAAKQPARKRSFVAAVKFITENLEAGQMLTLVNQLTTTDGYTIPANEQVSLTSIDSNTNLAYVTFGENSYPVTYAELVAAVGPDIAK